MIRRLTVLDVTAAARDLAAAFADDPHTRYVYRDDATRRARLERVYRTLIEGLWLRTGEALVAPGGAALWQRPGAWQAPPAVQARLLPRLLAVSGRDTPRALRAVTAMERHHPRNDHWYLPIVGVAPGAQGQGLGTALLAPVLRRCDAEGTPAYLEASTERSRALYERLGFAVTDEIRYASDGPPLWLMWREPRTHGGPPPAAIRTFAT